MSVKLNDYFVSVIAEDIKKTLLATVEDSWVRINVEIKEIVIIEEKY